MAQKTAIIVAHGMGNQRRYDYLKEASSAFFNALRPFYPDDRRLAIDNAELDREYTRTSETSDALPWNPNGVPRSRSLASLFRPVRILIAANGEYNEISFYEAYWADTDLQYTWFEKLRFTTWLTSALWNPFFNLLKGYYENDPQLPPWRVMGKTLQTLLVGILYHTGEGILLMLPFVGRFRNPSGRWNNVIHEYAGDIALYVSDRQFFHNQEKRDVIRARFDEVLIKALIENDEVHIVGHSLGSAVAFDGLTRHRVQISKMSEDFRDFLRECNNDDLETIDLSRKLTTLVSLGSPLDKLYFFFPWRRANVAQPDFSIRPEDQAGEQHFRVAELGEAKDREDSEGTG